MDQDTTSAKAPEQEPSPDMATGADHPEEEPHPAYEIDIFRDWCKSCGICAAFCPRQCLGLDADGAPVVERGERCTGCRWCELHCPDFAICVRELTAARPSEGKEDEM